MQKFFIQFAAISGLVAVSLGAFGAHALKDKLTSSGYLETFQTAVNYQFYHTLAILFVGILAEKYPFTWITYAGFSMMLGILLFSGSLYILSISGIKWLGAVTPLGGLAFIIGWFLLFLSIFKVA